jgi:hypothetical protein
MSGFAMSPETPHATEHQTRKVGWDMVPSIAKVLTAFNTARSRAELNKAERLARRLSPHQQLEVVDAILAADARLKGDLNG